MSNLSIVTWKKTQDYGNSFYVVEDIPNKSHTYKFLFGYTDTGYLLPKCGQELIISNPNVIVTPLKSIK